MISVFLGGEIGYFPCRPSENPKDKREQAEIELDFGAGPIAMHCESKCFRKSKIFENKVARLR